VDIAPCSSGDNDNYKGWGTSTVAVADESTRPSADAEEARLLRILAACKEAVTAASHALSDPSHSLLMPEYRELQVNLEMARAELEKATTALREYRNGHAE
jgi:hypothetical protein